MARAKCGKEGLFVQERTALDPVEDKLEHPLANTHTVVSVQTGPQLQGFPTRRNRSLTAGL